MGQWVQLEGGRHFACIFPIALDSSEHVIPSSALQRTNSASRNLSDPPTTTGEFAQGAPFLLHFPV